MSRRVLQADDQYVGRARARRRPADDLARGAGELLTRVPAPLGAALLHKGMGLAAPQID
jgi:hypothetical protein